MIEIGTYCVLKVVRESEEGLYLDAEGLGELLLPKEEVPTEYASNTPVEVFLYSNSKEVVVPTTKKPLGRVGRFSCLDVVSVSEIGAFLDWGLPKDLFVPISEQKEAMAVGGQYIVYIYKDPKRNRLAASSKLDSFLDKVPAEYGQNEKVDLLICHQTELGINAIINNVHWGLLYLDEVFQSLEYGQRVEGYIKKMRDDDKIDLSLEMPGYQKMDSLQEQIMSYLTEHNGTMDVTDKSSPESIYELFGVSKKKYKMALGSLYKQKRIVIEQDTIKAV